MCRRDLLVRVLVSIAGGLFLLVCFCPNILADCAGCTLISKGCATQQGGTCKPNFCYQYTGGNQSAIICGATGPIQGFCPGDTTLKCSGPGPTITYQIFGSCSA